MSAAASRLSLTQSAVSASLRRLRMLCGDELFLRSRDGMVPTRRALVMAEQVADAVAALQHAMLGDAPFEPTLSRRQFTIGLGPGLDTAIGPAVLRRLMRVAPDVTVHFRECMMVQMHALLAEQSIELGVGLLDPGAGRGRQDLHREVLGPVRFACIFDARACDVPPPLDLENFLALPHVLSMETRRDGPVDLALHAVGRTRRIASAVTHFSALPLFLIGNKVVSTVPVFAARAMAEMSPRLATCPVPLAIPELQLGLFLRREKMRDPGVAWLKDLVGAEVRRALLPSEHQAALCA